MKPLEIKKNVWWVGGVDWDLRSFHGYLTPQGSTYNAYLVIDEKIALVDTVKHYLFDEMMDRIKSVIDPDRIDYVVSNHVEMDHSGSLPKLSVLCKNAAIVTSPNGENGLKKHYGDLNYKVVNTGDTINIGKRNLKFVLMPMVHWPDSMATFLPEERLLMPNDAFGQHIASSERFDDELGWGIAQKEAAKYYANIILPYGKQVNKALDDLSGLDFDMIAPSHGIIWRRYLKGMTDLYRKWANNTTEERAVIVYDTMWGSTEKIARTIYEVFEERGIPANLINLGITDDSDVMTALLSARYICAGSPTLNSNMMPEVAAFLTYLKGLAPKNRTGLAFGSYGWGGQSVGQIEEMLSSCGFNMLEKIRIQYVPTEEEISKIKKELKLKVGGGK